MLWYHILRKVFLQEEEAFGHPGHGKLDCLVDTVHHRPVKRLPGYAVRGPGYGVLEPGYGVLEPGYVLKPGCEGNKAWVRQY